MDNAKDIKTVEDGETITYALKGHGLIRCLTVVNNTVVRYFYRALEYTYNREGFTDIETGYEGDWTGPDRVMRDMIAHLKLKTTLPDV